LQNTQILHSGSAALIVTVLVRICIDDRLYPIATIGKFIGIGKTCTWNWGFCYSILPCRYKCTCSVLARCICNYQLWSTFRSEQNI